MFILEISGQQLKWPVAYLAYFKSLARNLPYKMQPLEDFAQSYGKKHLEVQ